MSFLYYKQKNRIIKYNIIMAVHPLPWLFERRKTRGSFTTCREGTCCRDGVIELGRDSACAVGAGATGATAFSSIAAKAFSPTPEDFRSITPSVDKLKEPGERLIASTIASSERPMATILMTEALSRICCARSTGQMTTNANTGSDFIVASHHKRIRVDKIYREFEERVSNFNV